MGKTTSWGPEDPRAESVDIGTVTEAGIENYLMRRMGATKRGQKDTVDYKNGYMDGYKCGICFARIGMATDMQCKECGTGNGPDFSDYKPTNISVVGQLKGTMENYQIMKTQMALQGDIPPAILRGIDGIIKAIRKTLYACGVKKGGS